MIYRNNIMLLTCTYYVADIKMGTYVPTVPNYIGVWIVF